MKKFKILALVLIMLLTASLLPLSALAADEPEITAQAAILADADSEAVYFSKNADERIQPASTTKIVTALLVVEAIERGDIGLNDHVTASDESLYNLEYDSSNAGPQIQPGEIMTVQDLLYCAMLVSANEACNILAEYVAGSVSSFVDRMNERAAELGCENTHFTNANGLEDEDHYSTAADFAVITREALNHDLFEQICGTQTYTASETNMNGPRPLVNTNLLLNEESSFYYSYADGVKTGFFSNAGYCLVSSARKDDMRIICVVMGGQAQDDQFRDTIALYDWMFASYERRQVLSSTEIIVTVPVQTGTSDTIGVRAEDAVSVILPKNYDVTSVNYQYVLYHEQRGEPLSAPINAGEILGEISVVEMDDDGKVSRTFGTSYLVAAASVAMSRTEYIETELHELYEAETVRKVVTILLAFLGVYVLLVLFYFIRRIRHLVSLRRARRERARRLTEEESAQLYFPEDDGPAEPPIEYFAEEDEPAALAESADAEVWTEEPAPEERPGRSRSVLADDDFFDSFFKD